MFNKFFQKLCRLWDNVENMVEPEAADGDIAARCMLD
jgi:hypothetical protein